MPDLFNDLVKDNKVTQKKAEPKKKRDDSFRPPMESRLTEINSEGSPSAKKAPAEQDVHDFDAYKIVEEVEQESELSKYIVMGEVLNNPRFKKRRYFR